MRLRRVMRAFRPARGFTLIDTVIAIGILAILAAVVVPAVGSLGNDSLEAVARVLATDLRLARSQAIAHNTSWAVRFDPAANTYELVYAGTGTAPPLRNALDGIAAGPGYRVRLDERSHGGQRVRLAGAALESGTAVADVTFTPTGGTGPARSQDTVVVLMSGEGQSLRLVRLRISWVTGSVWIEPLAVGTPG